MNLDKVIRKKSAEKSYKLSFVRNFPFRFSHRNLLLGKALNEVKLRFWRKKYLDGRAASKVLLVHLGLPELRMAYYKNDLETCFSILGRMKEEQRRLGLFMPEILELEKEILKIEKKQNLRIKRHGIINNIGKKIRSTLTGV